MDSRRGLIQLGGRREGIWHQDLLFPFEYLLFVAVSAMDLMLTGLILSLGGWEVNPVAQVVLLMSGEPGIVGFKFTIVVLVVVMCETVGRRHAVKGRRLSRAAVAISAAPVVWSIGQLGFFFAFPG